MADLGSVAKTPGNFALNLMPAYRPLPVWSFGGSLITLTLQAAVDVTGALSGTVKREGTVIANAWVFLYYRKNSIYIGATRSASDGSFIFSPTVRPYIGLNKSVSDYFVLAIDPQSAFNAIIYDLLTPV